MKTNDHEAVIKVLKKKYLKVGVKELGNGWLDEAKRQVGRWRDEGEARWMSMK